MHVPLGLHATPTETLRVRTVTKRGSTPSPLSSASKVFKRTTLGLTPNALEKLDLLTEKWGVSKYLAVSAVLEACDPEDPAMHDVLQLYRAQLEHDREAKRELQDRIANLSPEQMQELSNLLGKL